MKMDAVAREWENWTSPFFQESSLLLQQLNACGVLWVNDDQTQRIGRLPEEAIISAIDQQVVQLNAREAISSDNLSDSLADTSALGTDIAGYVAVRVSVSPNSYLVWFRECRSKTIYWGGDPRKLLDQESPEQVMTPRKSFERWCQQVSGCCDIWTDQDLLRAQAIGLFFGVKQTEDSNRIKSRFLTNMSHEIRTPMTAILGYAEVLIDQLPAAEVECRVAAETISKSGSHLLSMLNDLLDIAKIESGKMEIVKEPVDVRAFAFDAINLVQASAKSKNNRLLFEIDPSVPLTVSTDPVRVKQVVINLLTNAIKFTENGSVALNPNYSRESL